MKFPTLWDSYRGFCTGCPNKSGSQLFWLKG